MKHKQTKKKTPCKQQPINLEIQWQINMLNLFVEFRFQLFNMKTLFYFKLRISAGMIENLKTRNITLIPTTFKSTEMFKNVGIFDPREMLIDTCVKMPTGFTNITSSTAGRFLLQVAGRRSQVAGHRSQVTGHRSQVMKNMRKRHRTDA